MRHWILKILAARTGLAAKMITATAAVFALSSCVKDHPGNPPVTGEEGVRVTISFSPMVDGAPASTATRAGYHGNPNDGELADPNNDPNLAKGNSLDIAVSELRVLLYNKSTGKLSQNLTPTISNSTLPAMLSVLTGTYDVVFIANEASDALGASPLLTDFLADEANYDDIAELETALIAAAAYGSGANIPMFGIEHNVQIVNNHTMVLNGTPVDTRNTPWSPELTRTGVRISLEITMEKWQLEEWDKNISLATAPNKVYLYPGKFNNATRESLARTYTATITDDVDAPAPVQGYDGYYWPVYVQGQNGPTTTIEKYIIRFDRIIVPELLFEDIGNANKALELSMTVAGTTLKAKVNSFDPETEIRDYTLPRNTWLHLDAKVNATTLELNPIVMNWNTLTLNDVHFDDKYFMELDRNDVMFLAEGGRQTIYVTTNHPAFDENSSFSGLSSYPITVTHSLVSSNHDGSKTYAFTFEKGVLDSYQNNNWQGGMFIAGKLRVSIIIRQIGRNKDDAMPGGIIPYVGAFWKSGQTGERLIRMPRPTNGSLDGVTWQAAVALGQDWIVLDRMMTDDPNVGWLPGANEQLTALGNDPGFDARYAVHGGKHFVTGTISADDPNGVYFRIGLKNTIAEGDHRYGVVLLKLKVSNSIYMRRIWIRQGEDPDHLFSKVEHSTNQNVRFSPYNLTIPKGESFGPEGYLQLDQRTEDSGGGAFTDYPTQAGAIFQFSSNTKPRYAYHPTDPASITGWDGVAGQTANWGPLTETCPPGYRRPTGATVNQEIAKSLLISPVSNASTQNVANALWGYYADGWFDRSLTNSVAIGDYGSVGSSVRRGAGVAYIGQLFYNPNHLNSNFGASIFFPAAGQRNYISTVSAAGVSGSYWSSSWGWRQGQGDFCDGLHFSSNSATIGYIQQRYIGLSIRCVEDPVIPPGMGGEGSTPQLAGNLAPPFVLAVDANGILNLDGQNEVLLPDGTTGIRPNNYVVAFQYGSPMAFGVGSGLAGTDYNPNVHVAWVPPGFTPPTTWTGIPNGIINGNDPTAGKGDPCNFAVKDGVVGNHQMPTSPPVMKTPDEDTVFGYGNESLDGSFFLPWELLCFNSSGKVAPTDIARSYFWLRGNETVESSSVKARLHLSDGVLFNTNGYTSVHQGFTIRCESK